MAQQKVEEQEIEMEEEAMTYDEASMKRSKNFISALQELRNLRPQLYEAAEYCEMSYLQNDQKQLVLENLKDYAVKALINAVDHLGTVAFKLTDLLSQQAAELSTSEVKVACLTQKLRMCQEYNDKQGIKQQFVTKEFPRYYKHYILPAQPSRWANNSANKYAGKVYESEHAKPHPVPHGGNANKSLSWHLAAEARTAFNDNSSNSFSNEFYSMSSIAGSEAFYFSETEYSSSSFPVPLSRAAAGTSSSSMPPNSHGIGRRDIHGHNKKLAVHLASDEKHQIQLRRQGQNRSLLATLFNRHKTIKQKAVGA